MYLLLRKYALSLKWVVIPEQKKRMPLKKKKVGRCIIGGELPVKRKGMSVFFDGYQAIQNLIPVIFLFKRQIFFHNRN